MGKSIPPPKKKHQIMMENNSLNLYIYYLLEEDKILDATLTRRNVMCQ